MYMLMSFHCSDKRVSDLYVRLMQFSIRSENNVRPMLQQMQLTDADDKNKHITKRTDYSIIYYEGRRKWKSLTCHTISTTENENITIKIKLFLSIEHKRFVVAYGRTELYMLFLSVLSAVWRLPARINMRARAGVSRNQTVYCCRRSVINNLMC